MTPKDFENEKRMRREFAKACIYGYESSPVVLLPENPVDPPNEHVEMSEVWGTKPSESE